MSTPAQTNPCPVCKGKCTRILHGEERRCTICGGKGVVPSYLDAAIRRWVQKRRVKTDKK